MIDRFLHPPMRPEEFREPRWARFLFASTTAAWLWLVVRLYVASAFLPAGWGKITSGKWLLGSNPALIILGTLLALAWRNAGWIGLDRWFMPWIHRSVFAGQGSGAPGAAPNAPPIANDPLT